MTHAQPPIVRLIKIMARLRAPDGCPWDREQTHASIKPQLIEEAYEVIEAIDEESPTMLKEELGDLLLHVVFHAQLAGEAGHFDFDQVAEAISDKLVRRHPHVFGDTHAPDSDTVLKNWDEIKAQEKPERTGRFDGIPANLPALMRAHEFQRKAAKVGFDWPNTDGPVEKIREELAEILQEVREQAPAERIEDEVGDLLFAVVNLSRHLKVDAEQALSRAVRKFHQRFEEMERVIEQGGRQLKDCTLEEMDTAWDSVKAGTTAIGNQVEKA